jgi:lactoylglutathione lyase
MRVTGTHHLALATADLERMRAFYVDTLGLPQVGVFPGGQTIFIDAGSTTIELGAREGWQGTDTGSWRHLAFEVEDVDATYAELTAQGISFRVTPKDVPADAPVCRVAFFRDPDGNDLELFQPIGSRYPQGGA